MVVCGAWGRRGVDEGRGLLPERGSLGYNGEGIIMYSLNLQQFIYSI